MKIKYILILVITVLAFYTVSQSTVIYEGTVRRYTGLSSDTKPTLAAKDVGSMFEESDTGIIQRWNGSAWYIRFDPITTTVDSLKAPGKSTVISLKGFESITYYLDVSALNTDVTVYMEARSDSSGWTNLDAEGDSTVIAGNGTWGFNYNRCTTADSTRMFWSAESGGNDAIIAVYSERAVR